MVKSLDSVPWKKDNGSMHSRETLSIQNKNLVWVTKNKTFAFCQLSVHKFFQAKVGILLFRTAWNRNTCCLFLVVSFQCSVLLFRTAWNHNTCCHFLIVPFQCWRYNPCAVCFATRTLAKAAPTGTLLAHFHVPVSTRPMVRIYCVHDLELHAPCIYLAGYRAIWWLLLALGSLRLLAGSTYLLVVCQRCRKFVLGPFC